MLTVSLLIEILRTRPRLIFWLAALTQTFLWFVVPTIFYSAPPGDVADVVAVGRELAFSAGSGPPLANWIPGWLFMPAPITLTLPRSSRALQVAPRSSSTAVAAM